MFVFHARRYLVFILFCSIAISLSAQEQQQHGEQQHGDQQHGEQQHSEQQHAGHQHSEHQHGEGQESGHRDVKNEPQGHSPSEQGRDHALLKREIPPPSEQNLNFEDGESAVPWILGGKGYSLQLDTEHAQSGDRSLRIRYEGSGRFAVASLPFDAKTVQGKRLRLTGYLKSEDIATGHAGLWMRVDVGHQMAAFDNMSRRGVSGTTPWTRYVIELDVPEGATRIFYGALLTGIGTVWADNLSFESFDIVPPEQTTIHGRVVDADGKATRGAHVALSVKDNLQASAISGEDGTFQFEQVPVGEYRLTATTSDAFASSEPIAFGTGPESQTLTLSRNGASITGTLVQNQGEVWADAILEMTTWAGGSAQVFVTRSRPEGSFTAQIPAADVVIFETFAQWEMALGRILDVVPETHHHLDLIAIRRGVPPNGMVADFVDGSTVFATTHPNQPTRGIEQADAIIGEAKVVALGEASPGTRDIFQLKHRLAKFLVEKKAFTTIALPLSAEAGSNVDRFVQTGDGDPQELLGSVGTWTWNTQEALDLLNWMRTFRTGDKPLRVIGYADVEPEALTRRLGEALAGSPDSKWLLWGSNHTLSRKAINTEAKTTRSTLGAALAHKLGDDYLAIGGFFSQGAFLAVGQGPDSASGPSRFWAGPAGKTSLETLFVRMGGKLSIQDLRHFAPDSPVGKWLAIPRPARDVDETYWGEKAMTHSILLPEHFDAVFFVESTTRARLLN